MLCSWDLRNRKLLLCIKTFLILKEENQTLILNVHCHDAPLLKFVYLQQVYAYIIRTLLEINHKQVKLNTFYRRKMSQCQHTGNYLRQKKQKNNVIDEKNIEIEDLNHSCSR